MKRPTVPLAPGVARAAAELVLIVAGVLIALGAQSWWEGRQLDEERARVRAGVSADLDALIDDLDDSAERADRILSDIRWLLRYSPAYAEEPDSVFNRRVTFALWEIARADPGVPAYDDLKGSGRLDLLPSEARAIMTRLDLAMANLEGIDNDVFQYQIRNLDPWLLDNAPLRSMLSHDQDDREIFDDSSERLPAAVLTSRRVENMLLAKMELTRNLRQEVGDLSALAEEAKAALREESDRRGAPGTPP